MTTQDKALAMVREEDGEGYLNYDAAIAALCRAIEQHEAFRQEMSDALLEYYGGYHNASGEPLERFIIPAPQPDPLVSAMDELEWCNTDALAKDLRDTLDALGFEIREKNDG